MQIFFSYETHISFERNHERTHSWTLFYIFKSIFVFVVLFFFSQLRIAPPTKSFMKFKWNTNCMCFISGSSATPTFKIFSEKFILLIGWWLSIYFNKKNFSVVQYNYFDPYLKSLLTHCFVFKVFREMEKKKIEIRKRHKDMWIERAMK